jgi:hypothetical protein
VSDPQPVSAFIRLMQSALEDIQSAETSEARKAAEARMAAIIRAQVKGQR